MFMWSIIWYVFVPPLDIDKKMFYSTDLLTAKGGKFNMIWLLGVSVSQEKKRFVWTVESPWINVGQCLYERRGVMIRIRWILKILASWIWIRKNMGIQGVKYQLKTAKKNLLRKPKSDFWKKRDDENFLISEWFEKYFFLLKKFSKS